MARLCLQPGRCGLREDDPKASSRCGLPMTTSGCANSAGQDLLALPCTRQPRRVHIRVSCFTLCKLRHLSHASSGYMQYANLACSNILGQAKRLWTCVLAGNVADRLRPALEVPPMASKPSLDALKAAYYRVHDPALTQEQIASKAGLGKQAQVSRLLKDARDHNVLQEVFRFPADLPAEDRLEIVNSFFARHGQLEDALSQRSRKLSSERSVGGSPFKRLHVVAAPGIENEKDARVRANAFRSFGMSAAGIVASYIDEVDMCCVAWGRTIAATVEHVPNSSASNGKKQFIPIAGEPTNHEPNGVSPSDAARRLSLAWPGSNSLSLRGVQARIPKSVHDQDGGRIARELVRFSTSYRQIFEAPDSNETPLISEVPMILTGIGNADTSKRTIAGVGPDPWFLETVEAEEPNILELAVGNIGGVWIARNEISDEDKEQVAKVNERWLGAQYDHFRSCSLNADLLHRRPGVVVLAVETDKADIVLEALHLINVLIISRQLADELARRLLGARG